jgi:hypothetical protein
MEEGCPTDHSLPREDKDTHMEPPVCILCIQTYSRATYRYSAGPLKSIYG